MAGRTIYWDVDTQVDFMDPAGRLYVPGAEHIVGQLGRLTRHARAAGMPIVHTADDHEVGDEEIAVNGADFVDTFPPHCLRGTPGADRIPETAPAPGTVEVAWDGRGFDAAAVADAPAVLVHKKRFDVFSNPAAHRVLDALAPSRVVVYGVALDVCDRYAVEGLLARGDVEVVVVRDATAAIDVERGSRLLDEWADRGVTVADTADVTAGAVGAS
jgi:nicotinamidase/pyrazinamidase